MSKAVILDGAQGTELERRGLDLSHSHLWSSQLLLDDPAVIREIHLDYLRAGADVITTVTYQASIAGLERSGLTGDAISAVLRSAVTLAAEARSTFMSEQASAQGKSSDMRVRPLIAYSCGSYGACLSDGSEFHGNYAESVSIQELKDFHRMRIEPVRNDPNIDLLAFETVPCLKEAIAIAELLQEEKYSFPAWVSFSCKSATETCHGEGFAEGCVPAVASCPHIVAVGVNCLTPVHASALLSAAALKLKQLEESVTGDRLLLLCYPNSGEDYDAGHRCWVGEAASLARPEAFATEAERWVRECGLSMVGGCCRTTPEHIRAVRAAVISASR
ncbi:MAG: hypothetical protein WDW36_005347 [Sanguina aurantia]